MNARRAAARGRLLTAGLAVAAGTAVATLAFLGYHATAESRRGAEQLASHRAEESADLLLTALARDMRGAHTSVLASRDWTSWSDVSLLDMNDQVSSAFARYPYPESFFGWRENNRHRVVFFNRASRPPAWMAGEPAGNRYPVVPVTNPPGAESLIARIRQDAVNNRRYSLFETVLGGEPYQVVARLQYRGPFGEELEEVFGFTVNLRWVARSYFSEITAQVARMSGERFRLAFAVFDERGRRVTGFEGEPPATTRRFPLLFFDPAAVVVDSRTDLPIRTWKVQVSSADDPTLVWATRTAQWTRVVMFGAALALGVSLILTFRAVRHSAALAEMRSDFVSTVTHELKTPLATIRAVGDTLVRGRLTGEDTVADYARMLVQEAKHLTRLVDNLLAYARVTDLADVYSFEHHALAELIDDVLQAFRHQLVSGGFEVQVDLPPDLPPVRADRTAIRLAFDNLVDNAIRYSGERRSIQVVARSVGARVVIEFRDRGVGIPAEELETVQKKFIRGRFAPSGGSGLGLAIVRRIVTDHGGTVSLASEVGVGTTVCLDLPAVEA